MKRNRKKYDPKFKSDVVMELLSNRVTINEMAEKYQIHHSVILRWKSEFMEKAHLIFETKADETAREKDELIETLYKTIGQRDIELEWMKKKVGYFHK